ncbi:MAG: hypothetical protein L0Z50_15500 [Verrucomicrobiales bacterium]|nr:hypothetical protein [Verrucomicrobiales bacterium]
MKTRPSKRALLVLTLNTAVLSMLRAAEAPLKLSVHHSSNGNELTWPATIRKLDGSIVRPFFELQGSTDLRSWLPLGERLRAPEARNGQVLSVTPPATEALGFFRLLQIDPPAAATLGQAGAQIFGYDDAFAAGLQRIGQITPEQFADMFAPAANYPPAISWDPTTARFWDQFNADPQKLNGGKNSDSPGYRFTDYRLNASEL